MHPAPQQVPYFPPLQSGADFTPARCAEIVRQVARQADLALQVRTIRAWTMAGRVAHAYSSGRAFLVGDAAHAFPPSGAFGMNTGVCDAHNLAWKLAAVLEGRAGAALLDSYTGEGRRAALLGPALLCPACPALLCPALPCYCVPSLPGVWPRGQLLAIAARPSPLPLRHIATGAFPTPHLPVARLQWSARPWAPPTCCSAWRTSTRLSGCRRWAGQGCAAWAAGAQGWGAPCGLRLGCGWGVWVEHGGKKAAGAHAGRGGRGAPHAAQ